MAETNNYIFKLKINRILSYIEDLKSNSDIAYEDVLESELRGMIQDLVENPHEFTEILINEMENDDYFTSVQWNNFVNIMIEYSSLFDDILLTCGIDLNSFIMKHVSLAQSTDALLKKQLDALDVLELDIKTSASNKSITDEQKFNDAPIDFISIPYTKSKLELTNITTDILTPTNKINKISLTTNKIVGLKDTDIFSDGYFVGRMNSTDKIENTAYEMLISNAFDNRFEKAAEYEYVSYDINTGNFKLTCTGTLNTSGKDAVTVSAYANRDAKFYISFDNNSWQIIEPYQITASDANISQASYFFYTKNNTKTYIKMEFIDNNPEAIKVKRLAVTGKDGKVRQLNYIESAMIQKSYQSNVGVVCNDLLSIFNIIGANYNIVLEKMKKDNTYSTDIKSIAAIYVPAYRFSIQIPEIYINAITFSNQTTVEYVSDEFSTNNDILAAEVSVYPISANLMASDIGSIDVFISPDKSKWTQILPSNFANSNKALPTRVLYNDNYTDTLTSTTITTDVKRSIYVKLVIKKTGNTSPVILNYTLRTKVAQ